MNLDLKVGKKYVHINGRFDAEREITNISDDGFRITYKCYFPHRPDKFLSRTVNLIEFLHETKEKPDGF